MAKWNKFEVKHAVIQNIIEAKKLVRTISRIHMIALTVWFMPSAASFVASAETMEHRLHTYTCLANSFIEWVIILRILYHL